MTNWIKVSKITGKEQPETSVFVNLLVAEKVDKVMNNIYITMPSGVEYVVKCEDMHQARDKFYSIVHQGVLG